MREIKLTKCKVATVDDEDYEMLSKHKWYAINPSKTRWYAARTIHVGDAKKMIYMHQILCPSENYVDHINGDGLDNRRSNLRICTNSQNMMNQSLRRDNVSGFKGVSKHSKVERWCAFITANGVKKYLGIFKTPEEAYAVYCSAAEMLHGEFAKTK